MQAVYISDKLVLVPNDRMFLVPYVQAALGKKVLVTKADYGAGPAGVLGLKPGRGYYHEVVFRDHHGRVTDKLDWKTALILVDQK